MRKAPGPWALVTEYHSSGMKPVHTPDRRYIVVRGRLWRASNPNLSEEVRARLVRELMQARREVKESIHSSDAVRLAAARASVDAAKIALGERGPVWWDDGTEFDRHLVANTPYAQWYLDLEKSA
jgi:hypothetical protein